MSVQIRIGFLGLLSLVLTAFLVVSMPASAESATTVTAAKAVPVNVSVEKLYASNLECSIKAAVAIDAPVIGYAVIKTFAATPTTPGYVRTTVTASLAPGTDLLFNELVYLLPDASATDYCSGTPKPFQVKRHAHKTRVSSTVNFPPGSNWAQTFIEDANGRPIACTRLYSVFVPTS